eukprot:gene22988-biopygen16310
MYRAYSGAISRSLTADIGENEGVTVTTWQLHGGNLQSGTGVRREGYERECIVSRTFRFQDICSAMAAGPGWPWEHVCCGRHACAPFQCLPRADLIDPRRCRPARRCSPSSRSSYVACQMKGCCKRRASGAVSALATAQEGMTAGACRTRAARAGSVQILPCAVQDAGLWRGVDKLQTLRSDRLPLKARLLRRPIPRLNGVSIPTRVVQWDIRC